METARPLRFSLRYFRMDGRLEGAACPEGGGDLAEAGPTFGAIPPVSAVPSPGGVRDNPAPSRPRTVETDRPEAAATHGPRPPALTRPGIARNHPAFPPAAEHGRPAALTIRVNQTAQRLSVVLRGSPVEELAAVPVSTGRPGAATRTPDGSFRINPYEIRERRQSRFATRLLKRPVFLTHAVQITGGIFMHDASHGAMAYLGQKRSHGCVRVDGRKMPEIFRLVQRHRFDTRVHIFHQGS